MSWEKFTVDQLAYFVARLNGLVDDTTMNLNKHDSKRSERTINQIVHAIGSFYQFQHKLGHVQELQLYQWRKSFVRHKAFKPFLHHLSKSKPKRGSILKLKERQQIPKVVEAKIIKKMVDSCNNLRDKLLIFLLYESGCRIGQALGLRHEDMETFDNTFVVRLRNDNLNLARAKTL